MMKNSIFHILSLSAAALSAQAGAKEISFNRDIRPILSDRCFKCHGPDAENQKSDFRLDTREHAIEDLGGYFGIVPGDLENSEVHHLIRSEHDDEIMPPADSNLRLSDAEKDIIDEWIKQGAQFDKHWSLKELPAEIPVPAAESDWARNEIDRFIEAGFKENKVTPAPESPREKWLRRVYFDLTGLPPSPEDIAGFLSDDSPDAYEKVTDRLLNSSAYAERMTSEWLDVARYSDSYGYQRDRERFVWPWRDWVIDSFQKNMPYDEFITLQLAGDLLPDASPETILPTAFNRLHGHEMEGGIVLEEYRMEYIADRINTFSYAFLGLTMECCRCHDHKYDPLPTKDYYSLGSFFANIDETGLISYFSDASPSPSMPISTPEIDAQIAAGEERVTELETQLLNMRESSETAAAFAEWSAKGEFGESPGLIAKLSFDELKDNHLVNDVAPDAPVKTPSANVLVPGVNGNAIRFTGDDMTEIKDVGHFTRAHPFSGSAWVKPKQISARENLFGRTGGADDAASIGYEFLLLDGKPTASVIHFWPGNGMRVQAKQAIKAGEWQHLTVTYDGSSKASGLKIFLNGEPMELEVLKDNLAGQTHIWTGKRQGIALGERFRDRGFINGEMDDFHFYERTISPLEARALYLQQELAEVAKVDESAGFDYFFSAIYTPAVKLRKQLYEARNHVNEIADARPAVTVMRELPEPKPAFILERGVYDNHGEPVTANTPSALPPFPKDQPQNRLGLANWLLDPAHPLTARVTVNRYWQMIFGNGIVKTSEDFGSQGSLPTHPELLDWLARDFISHGWDVHHLLRQMVLSSTYRQSTLVDEETRERDPENEFFCRSNAQRLTGEMIRDNALAVSGLLVDKVGGPPVKPYELAVSFDPQKPDKGDGLYRRSLYTLWKRNAPAPILVTFDAPKRDVCSLKRAATVSPLQSLVTLNGPQFVEASRVLAAQLLKHHGKDREALISDAFVILTSRKPIDQEVKILNRLYDEQLEEFSANPKSTEGLLTTGEAPVSPELSQPDLAAATVVINTLINFDESLYQR
ncbi:DUF1553 domain-containing protein [Luteolibacter algae]|uniref:DUF1553 domain-containing protein n=1 Tax=Luteolibacter algae TaxID=454151 RepID=A0ABW5DE26_9BACT